MNNITADIQIQGRILHLVYSPLGNNNHFIWSFDLEKYSNIDKDMMLVADALLRQHYSEQIQHDLLEHFFYYTQMPADIVGQEFEDWNP